MKAKIVEAKHEFDSETEVPDSETAGDTYDPMGGYPHDKYDKSASYPDGNSESSKYIGYAGGAEASYEDPNAYDYGPSEASYEDPNAYDYAPSDLYSSSYDANEGEYYDNSNVESNLGVNGYMDHVVPSEYDDAQNYYADQSQSQY